MHGGSSGLSTYSIHYEGIVNEAQNDTFVTPCTNLEPGYFGIMEPKDGLKAATYEHAFLVMPGVAFDKNRHRVGYGGGFYDRYLEKYSKLYK